MSKTLAEIFSAPPGRREIKQLRQAIRENTATFGARLGKSGRTIECWEQGSRRPDVLAQRELARIARRVSAVAK